MPRDLTGQRVLVTGASGAFGQAILQALRERGAQVRGLDLQAGPEVWACDITDDDAVRNSVRDVIDELGGLDALINNAGVGDPNILGDGVDATVMKVLQVNLLGSWRVTAAALDALVASKGRVVFVSSGLAVVPIPLCSAYQVSKRGVAALADALRAEYGTHVGVTTVYPGFVATPIHDVSEAAGMGLRGSVPEESVEQVVATIVRALVADRPKRDLATSRQGAFGYWVARRQPALVDRLVRREMVKRWAGAAVEIPAIAKNFYARSR